MVARVCTVARPQRGCEVWSRGQPWALYSGFGKSECAGSCHNIWTPGTGAGRQTWKEGCVFQTDFREMTSDCVFYIPG